MARCAREYPTNFDRLGQFVNLVTSCSSWKLSQNAVFCDLDDRAAVLETTRNSYYLLEGIGKFLWLMLEQGASLDDMTDAIVREFDVERDVAAKDAEEWLQSLIDAGLAIPADS